MPSPAPSAQRESRRTSTTRPRGARGTPPWARRRAAGRPARPAMARRCASSAPRRPGGANRERAIEVASSKSNADVIRSVIGAEPEEIAVAHDVLLALEVRAGLGPGRGELGVVRDLHAGEG